MIAQFHVYAQRLPAFQSFQSLKLFQTFKTVNRAKHRAIEVTLVMQPMA
jgi:hypothetical protein